MKIYRFESRKVNFQGEFGYMVKQFRGDKCVTEQFVSETGYKDFCQALGIVPELVER